MTTRDGRIVVDDLTKVFGGKVRAVDRLSFAVEPGSVTGFLGPNGADALRAMIPPPATVEQTGPDALVVRGATTAEVGHQAFVAGAELQELRGDRVDLEELFFALTEGAA